MKRYPKGIPLTDFTAKFEVEFISHLCYGGDIDLNSYFAQLFCMSFKFCQSFAYHFFNSVAHHHTIFFFILRHLPTSLIMCLSCDITLYNMPYMYIGADET